VNPTIASFRGAKREFRSSKEAYIWLVERFLNYKSDLISDDSWDLLVIDTARSQRNYFARTPKALFPEDDTRRAKGNDSLADNPNNYVLLPNGWYANANLDNGTKRKILTRLGEASGLANPQDWTWEVLP